MKTFKTAFSIVYSLLLIYVCFFLRRRRHLTTRLVNIVPLKNTVQSFTAVKYTDSKALLELNSNLWGNILMFIPFSIILISLFRIITTRSILLSALLTSLLIECLQLIFKAGVADIDDVLLNVLGAATGIALYNSVKGLCNGLLEKKLS